MLTPKTKCPDPVHNIYTYVKSAVHRNTGCTNNWLHADKLYNGAMTTVHLLSLQRTFFRHFPNGLGQFLWDVLNL